MIRQNLWKTYLADLSLSNIPSTDTSQQTQGNVLIFGTSNAIMSTMEAYQGKTELEGEIIAQTQ